MKYLALRQELLSVKSFFQKIESGSGVRKIIRRGNEDEIDILIRALYEIAEGNISISSEAVKKLKKTRKEMYQY